MATSKKRKGVRRARPASPCCERNDAPPKPRVAMPLPVDNRILIIRRMRALGSTTDQIACTMGLSPAAVLCIETC